MFGKRLGPRPAAHSIFKSPREIDENACPPLAERIGGGAGAGTESNRTTPIQSHHARGAREVSIHAGNRFEQSLECTQESKRSRFCQFSRGGGGGAPPALPPTPPPPAARKRGGG